MNDSAIGMADKSTRMDDRGVCAGGADDSGLAGVSVPRKLKGVAALVPGFVSAQPGAGYWSLARLRRRGTEYQMIDVIDRKHQRPALNDEVDPLVITDANGKPETTYTVSQAGSAAGDKRLVWHWLEADDARYYAFRKH